MSRSVSEHRDQKQKKHHHGNLIRKTHAHLTTENSNKSGHWNDTFKGYATYTGSGYVGGAASLDPIPSHMKITALNPFQYNYNGINAAMAGAYLKVKGPKGHTIVYVTDLYPEGASGALDLSPNAFSKIGNMVDGKIDIRWKIVQAPITGNLSYRIKEGSSQWWAGIQIRNHKFPVVKLEYSKDKQWINLKKMPYNHFVGNDLGNKPLRLRMTDIRGITVIDSIPSLPDDGSHDAYIVPGNIQFPDSSNIRRRSNDNGTSLQRRDSFSRQERKKQNSVPPTNRVRSLHRSSRHRHRRSSSVHHSRPRTGSLSSVRGQHRSRFSSASHHSRSKSTGRNSRHSSVASSKHSTPRRKSTSIGHHFDKHHRQHHSHHSSHRK